MESTSRPGGTQPLGAGQRGWISRADGTQPPVVGRGGRQAGTAGLGLRARGTTSLPGSTQLEARAAGIEQPARRNQPPGAGQRGWISRAGGTQPPCTVSVGSTSLPGGLSLRVRSTEVDQPARRDSASGRGAPQPAQWDSASGCGATPALPAGLSLCGRVPSVLSRRDSASRRGPRGSTSRLGGTRPPGAGQHGWISRAGGTQPPCTVSVGSTSQPDGLSLRVRCSTSLPGALSLLARDAGVDHPARWYSASVCGPRGRPACPAGLILLAQAAGVYQPARRDSASVHGVRGFYQPARQTQPAGAVHGGRPAFPAGLSLEARGSVVGSALQAGLSLPARCPWVLPACPVDSTCGYGPPRSTSRPGVIRPPGAVLSSRHSGTQPPGAGHHQPSLRTEPPCTGLHQPAQQD